MLQAINLIQVFFFLLKILFCYLPGIHQQCQSQIKQKCPDSDPAQSIWGSWPKHTRKQLWQSEFLVHGQLGSNGGRISCSGLHVEKSLWR